MAAKKMASKRIPNFFGHSLQICLLLDAMRRNDGSSSSRLSPLGIHTVAAWHSGFWLVDFVFTEADFRTQPRQRMREKSCRQFPVSNPCLRILSGNSGKICVMLSRQIATCSFIFTKSCNIF